MDENRSLTKHDPGTEPLEPWTRGPAVSNETPPWVKVHAVLRGRYRWLLMLAVPLAIAGFMFGYNRQAPVYRSEGLVRIEPVLPKILYKTDDNRLMPMFMEYVEDKAGMFKNRAVIDAALQHPVLDDVDLGSDMEARARFSRGISVKRMGSRIAVYFNDPDPVFAQKATNALVDAYKKQFDENETKAFQSRLTQLERRRTHLQAEMDSVKESMLSVADGGTFEDVRAQWARASETVRARKSELDRIDLQIRLLEEKKTRMTGPGAEDRPGSSPESAGWTVAQIAMLDASMDNLVQGRERLQRAMDKDLKSYGPQHAIIQSHREAIAEADLSIEKYAQRWRLQQKAGPRRAGGPLADGDHESMLKELKQNRRFVGELYRTQHQRVNELSDKKRRLLDLGVMANTQLVKLKEAERALDTLRFESARQGRLTVREEGTLPTRPHEDKRLVMGMLGAMGGSGAGFLIVLVMGLLDHRIRNMGDAENFFGRVSILGILPQLPDVDDLPDAEQDAIAAHCVHQVRTMLQIRPVNPRSGQNRIIMVTSPGSRDGKTSLALSLGFSYATTGARTLLIDADLVGGGLSHRTTANMLNRFGRTLVEEGRLSQEQFDRAMTASKHSERPLGEVLVELGYMSQDEADQAISKQRLITDGLIGALRGQPLADCVAHLDNTLDVLSIGEADYQQAYNISGTNLKHVLDQAREAYDVVVVDTGPVPGSLEASHAAVDADAVVIVASRGSQRENLRRSIDHLESIGANIAGIVFNRAEGWDVQMAASSSAASRSRSRPRDGDPSFGSTKKQSSRIDPIARAVSALKANKDDRGA